MSVTQREIARALNVSIMAVQRALNNSGYVSKELKKKVLAYAAKVNYRPHRGAQALVRRKTRLLALFSIDEPEFFWNEVARGVSMAYDQIAPFGFDVQYHRIAGRDTRLYVEQVERALAGGVEAVAIVNNDEFRMQDVFSLLETRSIPYITLNVDAPQSRRLCFVGPDYVQEGVMAADILGKIMGGRGSVGILVSPPPSPGSRQNRGEINSLRRQGFLSWMASEYPGISFKELLLDHTLPDKRVQAAFLEWLAGDGKAIDALYCIPTYHVVIGRALEAAGRGGRTPMVTFDLSESLKGLLRRNIVAATICQKPIHQGYYAVKLLEVLTEKGTKLRTRELYISPQLVMKGNVDVGDDLFMISDTELFS